MERLLTPDFGLTFWTIATFLVLVAILGKYAWKPMIKALDERENGIQKAIADAAAAKQGAEALRQQLERELAASQARVQSMLNEAQADAQKIREKMLKEAEAESQRLSEQTRRQLEEEKARLSRELRKDVAALSIQVAEKLLRHQVNAKEQELLVQNFLKDLDQGVRTGS